MHIYCYALLVSDRDMALLYSFFWCIHIIHINIHLYIYGIYNCYPYLLWAIFTNIIIPIPLTYFNFIYVYVYTGSLFNLKCNVYCMYSGSTVYVCVV